MHVKKLLILGFTKPEALGVGIILLAIFVLSLYNFQISQIKARDAQRKADLGRIQAGLANYFNDFNFFPTASSGKMIACGTTVAFEPCDWASAALRDLADANYPPYIEPLPQDPLADKGYSYTYLSNTRHFQLLASLEDKNDPEYNPSIEARGLYCGSKICNYGRADSVAVRLDEELPVLPATNSGTTK